MTGTPERMPAGSVCRRPLKAVGAAIVVAIVLAGCGNSDEDGAAPAGQSTSTTEDSTSSSSTSAPAPTLTSTSTSAPGVSAEEIAAIESASSNLDFDRPPPALDLTHPARVAEYVACQFWTYLPGEQSEQFAARVSAATSPELGAAIADFDVSDRQGYETIGSVAYSAETDVPGVYRIGCQIITRSVADGVPGHGSDGLRLNLVTVAQQADGTWRATKLD